MTRVFAIAGLVLGLLLTSLSCSDDSAEDSLKGSGQGPERELRQSGVVFMDADGDGIYDAGETPRSGIAVTNGRDVVVTTSDGRYTLALHGAGFVSITCPADASCPTWFRRASESTRDFGLVPERPAGAGKEQDDFFFVQMSDVHGYSNVEEMAGLSPAAGMSQWLPKTLVGWVVLRFIDRMYPERSSEEIVAALRPIVSKYRDVSDAWDSTVMMDYVEVAGNPDNGIIIPAVEIPRAFAEVASLRPEFVVNTGDMILEGNGGSPEAVEGWYDYYLQAAEESGLPIYETIGNNELAGTDNDDFPPTHPSYGKALFRRHFGPTRYSFDYGDFHFAAIDTHRPEFEPGDDEEWSFEDMEPDVRAWLDADLAQAKGRTIVILNHEPFHNDPAWQFDRFETAHDEGLFAEHDVAYVLAGHIHKNGFQDAPPEGGVTHITTGALSGLRWSLPTSFDSRGYRLVQARERSLYSAWKDLGQPLLGFVEPRGAATLHPASTHAKRPDALEGRVEVVAVAADVAAPFAEVRLFLSSNGAEEELPLERWSDFFFHADLDAERISGDAAHLELRAIGRDGAAHHARLDVSRAEAVRSP